MKVLLTGANGFIGSHVLDNLRIRGIPCSILLRAASNTRFIHDHLPHVEIRLGSISDPETVAPALSGITHVIHCAGCTKAVRTSDFYAINTNGTRNIVEAFNAQAGARRLVHVSSLAAAGPALAAAPAREEATPHPVSEYGKSKLAAEREVQNRCRVEYVILRPPAVYGPRDLEFLRLFKAVKGHLLPKPTAAQPLSLVFTKDLGEAVVGCLDTPAAAGRTYFVAAREIVTAAMLAQEIAVRMKLWTIPLPLPTLMMWPLCLAHEIRARLTGRANVLGLQKFAELGAPGWACDPTRLETELGIICKTTMHQGIAETLTWYRQQRWL